MSGHILLPLGMRDTSIPRACPIPRLFLSHSGPGLLLPLLLCSQALSQLWLFYLYALSEWYHPHLGLQVFCNLLLIDLHFILLLIPDSSIQLPVKYLDLKVRSIHDKVITLHTLAFPTELMCLSVSLHLIPKDPSSGPSTSISPSLILPFLLHPDPYLLLIWVSIITFPPSWPPLVNNSLWPKDLYKLRSDQGSVFTYNFKWHSWQNTWTFSVFPPALSSPSVHLLPTYPELLEVSQKVCALALWAAPSRATATTQHSTRWLLLFRLLLFISRTPPLSSLCGGHAPSCMCPWA